MSLNPQPGYSRTLLVFPLMCLWYIAMIRQLFDRVVSMQEVMGVSIDRRESDEGEPVHLAVIISGHM